jgi:hypothetical protein
MASTIVEIEVGIDKLLQLPSLQADIPPKPGDVLLSRARSPPSPCREGVNLEQKENKRQAVAAAGIPTGNTQGILWDYVREANRPSAPASC